MFLFRLLMGLRRMPGDMTERVLLASLIERLDAVVDEVRTLRSASDTAWRAQMQINTVMRQALLEGVGDDVRRWLED